MNSIKREKNNNEELVTKEELEISDSPIDINLDNYNFTEMINIFNISPNLNYEDNSQLFNTIQELNNNSQNFNNGFIILLRKIFVILNVITKYKDYRQVLDNNFNFNSEKADELIIKIKSIHNFQHIDPKNIIQLLLLENKDLDMNNNSSNKNIDNEREKIYNKLKINSDINNNNSNNNNSSNINNNSNNNNSNNINFDRLNDKIFNNFNNPIVPGTINSIKRITKYVNLHINSAFRNNYYKSQSTNFSYNLPNSYHNVVSLKLNSIELKHTWLLINERNNFFYIEINNEKFKIELDILQANINLSAEIINQLEIFKQEHNIDISFTLSNAESVLTNNIFANLFISSFNIINSLVPINIIFFEESDNNNFLNTLGWILGFRTSKYTNLSINKILNSETFFNINPLDTIYLSINDFQYNYNETNIICFDKTTLDDHILSKLSIDEFSTSIYINSSDYEKNSLSKRTYNGPINLSKIEVKLYDKFGNILDNKNYDFTFSLQLEILYENNDVLKINNI